MKSVEKSEMERTVLDKLREMKGIERRNDEAIKEWREHNAENEGSD